MRTNDVYTAKEDLERARKKLSSQSSETSTFWTDNMKSQLYDNVINHYDPETWKFISAFNEIDGEFTSWLNKLRKFDSH